MIMIISVVKRIVKRIIIIKVKENLRFQVYLMKRMTTELS